ncbi:hypothetical protein BH09ACT12_BH09ACT12_33540 [soil metagenome]
MDLADPATRDGVTAGLSEVYAGRPVLLGPGILAGYTSLVARLVALDSPVLVRVTGDGAGELPPPDSCTIVRVTLPPTASMTEEVRVLDRAIRALPDEAVAAIEAFDPDRRGIWHTSPFVADDDPILGRPVTGGRPASYLALEDKMLADGLWAAAGVEHAPHRICDVDRGELSAATSALRRTLGAVWSGDARDGINGGGNFVRWVQGADDEAAAFAFFAPRGDRVRVMGFLDGVPCSIHGFVLPDGTAVFRPVELAILRDPRRRRFVYGGLSTWWDPPPADREEMRAVARRVGAHLAAHHDYRGAFGIDGVLTTDGFRPTELNTRMTAGVSTIAAVDPQFFSFLQSAVVAGVDTGLGVDDLETLLPLMDAHRHGRPSAVGQGVSVEGNHSYPVAYDGLVLTRASSATPSELMAADTPVGFFAKIDPCTLLGPGDRLAPLNVALLAHLDATYDTGFGDLQAAPDVR